MSGPGCHPPIVSMARASWPRAAPILAESMTDRTIRLIRKRDFLISLFILELLPSLALCRLNALCATVVLPCRG